MIDPRIIQIRNPEESGLYEGLYLVPTPIGNLRDITLRALDVLTACDVVVCEDSRVTGKLFKAYGLPVKKKIVYNDHSNEQTQNYIMQCLLNGQVVAMVSDAGTPLISDPGYKLVRECLSKEIFVTALPGANAILPALQLSGMPSDQFTFMGFLPTKEKALKDLISTLKRSSETVVLYESPQRLLKTLKVMASLIPDREISVVREISKLYEEAITKNCADMADYIALHPVKGEIVLVLKGDLQNAVTREDTDSLIENALKDGQSVKEIASQISQLTGNKKKDVYARALELKQTHTL